MCFVYIHGNLVHKLLVVSSLHFFSICTRLMDKNEDYNFENLSGAAGFVEVIEILLMIHLLLRVDLQSEVGLRIRSRVR